MLSFLPLSFSFKTQYLTLGENTLHVTALSRDETYCVLKEQDTPWIEFEGPMKEEALHCAIELDRVLG